MKFNIGCGWRDFGDDWNETDELVQFIEVQTGTYFGEDDIVRIEDDYNRE